MSEVGVWVLDLDAVLPDELPRVLDPDEKVRASRFRHDEDRRRWISARSGLRVLLGRHLNLDPREVSFILDEFGKPSVTGRPLEFSLSHAGNFAAYAVAPFPIGIDLEPIDETLDFEPLAARFFSSRERLDLEEVDVDGRREAFFEVWTRKEAFVKAVGRGLSFPLDAFDVGLGPQASLVDVRTASIDRRAWDIRTLEPPTGYAGAVAGKTPRLSLLVRKWDLSGDKLAFLKPSGI